MASGTKFASRPHFSHDPPPPPGSGPGSMLGETVTAPMTDTFDRCPPSPPITGV